MQALRDLMRMEMPERWCDVTTDPGTTLRNLGRHTTSGELWQSLPAPSLQRIYHAKVQRECRSRGTDHQQAKCLYLWVMTAIPEAKTMFSGSEIAECRRRQLDDVHRRLGQPHRLPPLGPGRYRDPEAAGTPSRARAGRTSKSTIPAGNNLHHDPFDPNFVETNAYHLYPLIFAGVLGKVNGVTTTESPWATGGAGRLQRHALADRRSVQRAVRGHRPRSARSCPAAVFRWSTINTWNRSDVMRYVRRLQNCISQTCAT